MALVDGGPAHHTAAARGRLDRLTAGPGATVHPGGRHLEDTAVCLLDPMLTTGSSAAMAIEGPKSLGARRVRLRCVVTAPEGVAYLEKRELEAEVYTGALDRPLNDCQYILRRPGDFGDRLVGT
jgi:uracil phosphoribosyltransferase